MARAIKRRHVKVAIPPFASGGNPGELLERMGMHARFDRANGAWEIMAEESTDDRVPQLVTVEKIGGTGVPQFQKERLREIAAEHGVELPPVTTQQDFDDQIARMGTPRDPVDVLAMLQLQATATSDADLPDVAAEALQAILALRGTGGLQAFPAAGVHAVIVNPKIRARTRFAPMILRQQRDQDLAAGRIEGIEAASARGELVFQSSQGLINSAFMFDAYVGPLLGAMSPAIWGFPVHKSFGPLLFSLGSTLSGLRQGSPAEGLQMLGGVAARTGLTYETLTAKSVGAATSWWAAKLDRLLSVVTDPATFIDDKSSEYRPVQQVQALMTVEQLFRKILSIQASYRDLITSRTICFTALDAIESLTGRNIEKLCEVAFARQALADVRASMTPDAAKLLLYSAERGVQSLEDLQDGFFLARQLGRADIEVESGKRLRPPAAAASYMRLLRNGTHGFMNTDRGNAARVESLLVEHNGEIPHDLPYIAYLHLLHLMINPEALRATLGRLSTPRR